MGDGVEPGWYSDPWEATGRRYWDGGAWTSETQPDAELPEPPVVPAASSPSSPSRPHRPVLQRPDPRRGWLVLGPALLVVILLAVGAVVTVRGDKPAASLRSTTTTTAADRSPRSAQTSTNVGTATTSPPATTDPPTTVPPTTVRAPVGGTVTVPALGGQLPTVESELLAAGLTVGTIGPSKSQTPAEKIPHPIVTFMTPPAGTVVPAGTAINLTVETGTSD